MYLENEHIRLRALEPQDATLVYMWENDSSLWPHGCTQAPLSLVQVRNYIDTYDADLYSSRQLRLMIESVEDGVVMGMVDMYDFDPMHRRAGIGIMIAPQHRGRGIGRMSLELLARYAYERLGMHQLWCVTAVGNASAIAMFRSAGYDSCGRLRSWIRIGESYEDALMMQRLLVAKC